MFLLLELALRIFSYFDVIDFQILPTESKKNTFLSDSNEEFGVWHLPNRTTRLTSECFDVEYKSNSYGARDSERSLVSEKERIVALGDSFLEGYGSEIDQRMSTIVERKSGIEVLNFGSSGDFGSIQQWLLYKSLASRFSHSEVHIYLLPDNDFRDNNIEHFETTRYRPYLRETADKGYELYYPVKLEDSFSAKDTDWKKLLKNKITNICYTCNLFRRADDLFKNAKSTIGVLLGSDIIPSYDKVSESDFKKLVYTYDQIAQIAGDKRIKIFVIPRLIDILTEQNGSNHKKIISLLNNYYQNKSQFSVIDLLPYYINHMKIHKTTPSEFYHSCDGHWSSLGNSVAADAVLASLDRLH